MYGFLHVMQVPKAAAVFDPSRTQQLPLVTDSFEVLDDLSPETLAQVQLIEDAYRQVRN